jgi:hypothetical protein
VLTLDELGIAFGLPNRLRMGSGSLSTFPLPPVQGLVGWLGALTTSTRSASTLPALIRREIHPPPTSTWFPKLSQSLGHEWIDEDTVSAKAAKHNDALPPIQLWNNRILMLFPRAHALLQQDTEFLRTLGLQRW